MATFTFLAIEKNGSATHVESWTANSKEGLKEFWDELSSKMDKIMQGWRYEVELEDGEITAEIQSWFDELDITLE